MPSKTARVFLTRDDEDESAYEFDSEPEYGWCEGLDFETWHVGGDAGQLTMQSVDNIIPNRRGCWPATLTVEVEDE